MVSQSAVAGGGVTFPLPVSGDTRTTLGPHHDRRAELLQGQDRLHHRGHGLHWQDHHREASQVGQEVTISLQSSELEAQNIVSILIISLSLQMHRCWQDLHSYPREEGCVAGCAAGDAGQVQGVHVKYRSTGVQGVPVKYRSTGCLTIGRRCSSCCGRRSPGPGAGWRPSPGTSRRTCWGSDQVSSSLLTLECQDKRRSVQFICWISNKFWRFGQFL